MYDYKKKYLDALERAKDMLSYKEVRREDMEYLFPELAESGNERIKKDIKRAISVALDYSYFDKETSDNCHAWLEKQKYTQKDVDDAYLKGVCDAKHELEKQGEQIFANSAQTCKIENYQQEGWYSSGDDEYIYGISFDEPIKLPVEFYYKNMEEAK